MRVTVRLFARLSEAAGRSQWDGEMPSGASVGDVWRTLTSTFPALEPFSGSVTCAVNADFARMTSIARDGDEIAFLPPVSGGSEGARIRRGRPGRQDER
jgi:molybdopterin converting factor subunit 1